MILDLNDILSCENKEIYQEACIEMKAFESAMGSFPVTKHIPFTLHIINAGNKTLQIQCSVEVSVSIPCDRCLEEVSYDFHLEINEELELDGNGGIRAEELEAESCMMGTKLDVDRLVHKEMLIHWPAKVLCKDDCRGICKKCGANLNVQTCGCDQTVPDPRMAAIQDIFNKYKEV